jgi:hypothetical protein
MIFLLHALFFLGGGGGNGRGMEGREKEKERETGLENLFHQSVVAVKALETDDGFASFSRGRVFGRRRSHE